MVERKSGTFVLKNIYYLVFWEILQKSILTIFLPKYYFFLGNTEMIHYQPFVFACLPVFEAITKKKCRVLQDCQLQKYSQKIWYVVTYSKNI